MKARLLSFALIAAGVMMGQSPFGILTSNSAPDPATEVANQVARLTKLLTLTTDQAAQATKIFTAALTAVTPIETTLSTDYTALEAAVKSNTITTVDSLSASIGTLTGQVIAIRNKADGAFYALLTPAQKTIFDARGSFGGPFGPGGPGGPGGRHH